MRSATDIFDLWNRRLHYYLGLYFLFFLWLFAFTGLLLNHPGWAFAEFWPNRRQSSFARPIQPPPAGGALAQARDLMRQLGVAGEIEWTAARHDATALSFRVSKPGQMFEIRADFGARRAAVQRIDLNTWGVVHILHTFTGVRVNDALNQRDWILTTVWALAMDALALGMVLMVVSSFYMWFRLKAKRRLGAAVLAAGFAACGLFVAGLSLLG